ncbi:MAG: TatD family hydrolase [Candidatus Yanofskybacteria bacterium]|nr:TatD family hydrolase [Candidatus Yanofskybacteria bacterium]
MTIIDSHCHPQFSQYDQDREEVIKRALDTNVHMICVGTDLEMSQKAVELSEKYDSIWASAGLHPTEVSEVQEPTRAAYEKFIKHNKVVAVGEVGLDYYRIKDKILQNKQKEMFIEFLDLAMSNKKPLIIHCREAYDDLLKIIGNSKISGVIHSFTSDFKTAEKFLAKGFFIGFNGIITFTDQYNEAVINTPLTRTLIETDAPYLTPEPYRGKRNEPSYVIEVAKKIAELKNIPVEEVTEQTTKNTLKLFGLND